MQRRRSSRALAALVLGGLALLLAGCANRAAAPDFGATGTPSPASPSPAAEASPSEATAATATASPEADDGLGERREEVARRLRSEFPLIDTSRTRVDLLEIVGLLPPDAIPSIDDPQFDDVETAGQWLGDGEPVIAFERGGDARAYPLRILTWHEIVNDVVGGEPVLVTYCPLCNSALAFSRVVDGETREFGVSGDLRRSDLLMFDRATHTLWQQLTGEAIVGAEAGTTLEALPAQIASFEEFAAAFPDGRVLNSDTGAIRDYGRNPYVYYDTRPEMIVGVPEFEDGRLDAKERVLAIEINGVAAAFPFAALSERLAIGTEVGGVPVVAFWQPGAVSALDAESISASREVGSAAAYSPLLGGESLAFEARGGSIFDIGTGSAWDVFGRAVAGPLAGSRLEPILSGSHFWFAWSVFYPDTLVIAGG